MRNLVTADLHARDSSTYRGCVDGFDAESGLLGWAVDLEAPEKSLSLRFVVDGMTLFEVQTSSARPDVSAAIAAPEFYPGFCVSTGNLRDLARLVALRPAADFAVEVGTSERFLPRTEQVPSLRAAVMAVVAHDLSYRSETDLVVELAKIAHSAELMTAFPLRPVDEARTGYVEAICTEDQIDGLTWIVGWMRDNNPREFPIMLVDGQRFSGAMTLCQYARTDLPTGAVGFVGLIKSGWRARPSSRPILYYGYPPQKHIVSLPSLPRISKQDVLGYVQRHGSSVDRTSWSDFYKVLTGASSWLVSSDEGIKCGVDRLILVPNFGCFLSGWVLSYSRPVTGFALKMGSTILPIDPLSLSFRGRPDLIAVHPGSPSLTGQAGFTCLFPGKPDLSTSEKPLLKIYVDGGATAIESVGLAHIRRLGYSEPLDSLLNLYPNLEVEPFFPSLSTALREEYLTLCRKIQIDSVAVTKECLILSLPSNRDDYYLVMEDIRFNAARHLHEEVGLILVADLKLKHGELEALVRDLRCELELSCSLVYSSEPAGALYLLKDILIISGSQRFCFLAVNEVFTQRGWEAAAKYLRSDAGGVVVFESIDPETSLSLLHNGASFGCNWDYFRHLDAIPIEIERQPSPLTFSKAGFQIDVKIVEAGTLLTHISVPGRTADLINQSDKDYARALIS